MSDETLSFSAGFLSKPKNAENLQRMRIFVKHPRRDGCLCPDQSWHETEDCTLTGGTEDVVLEVGLLVESGEREET